MTDRPSLAWTGTEYGVAWHAAAGTKRVLFFCTWAPGNSPSAPVLLDEPATGEARDPSLVWTGQEFALTWTTSYGGDYEIAFRKFVNATQGVIPVRITTSDGASLYPSLVYDGNGFGLAWRDNRTGSEKLFFTILDSNGMHTATEVLLDDCAGRPSLAWTGKSFAVAWLDQTKQIHLTQLSASGSPSLPQVALASDGLAGPSVVYTGSRLAAAWSYSNSAERGLAWVFLDRDSFAVRGAGKQATTDNVDSLAAVSAGCEWLGVAADLRTDGNVSLLRIRPDGTSTKMPSIALHDQLASQLALGSNGQGSFALAFSLDVSSVFNLHLRAIDCP